MTNFVTSVREMARRPIAHRGLHNPDGPPENSIAAAQAAIDARYAIECDVQLSADRVPYVFHDETLDRMTDGTGAFRDQTAAELDRLHLRGSKEPIPSLAAFLAFVAGRAPLFVELKRQDKRVLGRAPHHGRNRVLAEAVGPVVAGYEGDAAFMSFDPRLVVFSRKNMPDRPRGIVALGAASDNEGHVPGWQHWGGAHLLHLPWSRPHFIAYEAAALPAPIPIRAAAALGIPLLSWTIRSQREADRLSTVLDQIIFEGFVPEGT